MQDIPIDLVDSLKELEIGTFVIETCFFNQLLLCSDAVPAGVQAPVRRSECESIRYARFLNRDCYLWSVIFSGVFGDPVFCS